MPQHDSAPPLVDVLDDPERYYPGNFNTPRRMAALLTGLCQEAADELRRLHEENRQQAQLLTMIGTNPEREMAMKYRIAALEKALTQAVEALEDSATCVDSYYVPHGKRYLPEVEAALATARQTLGGTHD